MDVAVDHIQEEALSPEAETAPGQQQTPSSEQRTRTDSNDLGTEFKEAYQAVTSTAWGARLGGFFGQVRKQGEDYLKGAKEEFVEVSAEANKGWSNLVSQAQALSVGQRAQAATDTSEGNEKGETANAASSSQQDFLKQTGQFVTRFKQESAARLKQVQAAEDAADEALEKFGMNMKSWLRDAVTIAPPADGDTNKEVLFESKDAEGKRVVHATRFDAQLHVIHSRLSNFQQDPDSEEFKPWKQSFDAEKKTDAIKKDLEKYDELRRAMEKLVPEQVSYADFWTRYYFLRHVIETEEQKRRELLKGAQIGDEEEVAWDDDDEEDQEKATTPAVKDDTPKAEEQHAQDAAVEPRKATESKENDLLKPREHRRSNEHSVADSDASYDIVSGAPSRGPETPKDEKSKSVGDQSDEEDWE